MNRFIPVPKEGLDEFLITHMKKGTSIIYAELERAKKLFQKLQEKLYNHLNDIQDEEEEEETDKKVDRVNFQSGSEEPDEAR